MRMLPLFAISATDHMAKDQGNYTSRFITLYCQFLTLLLCLAFKFNFNNLYCIIIAEEPHDFTFFLFTSSRLTEYESLVFST